jgi:hypothetical protein
MDINKKFIYIILYKLTFTNTLQIVKCNIYIRQNTIITSKHMKVYVHNYTKIWNFYVHVPVEGLFR